MSIRRVLVLARAGAARERTEAALRQAGAELVAVLDPVVAEPEQVRAQAPDAVLVVLDTAVELALEKFDAVLADPGLQVLFDDVEVAARREGWEAARWARHLAAKLQGHHEVLPAPPARATGADFAQEMQALTLEMASMPPVAPAVAASAHAVPEGAVVVAAGIGGPDAVRQLLGELPETFPRPVLLRQRIDGGQYDRLVRQMQRATRLPVVLAQSGEPVRRGHVHVMPDGLDVAQAPAGLHFVETGADPGFAALRPADSAMLLLSGAPLALVDVALAMRLAGGLALGQAEQHCFDPAASRALVARGGEALSLAGISHQLLQRWSA
ncbi:chemotaxis protein CheB [Thermomonas sp.]|uniref:chemotaxis protein CheB n=1 Tax=Thermomonas sp. TaxID=1971895 RepID=UPI00391B96BC